MGNTILPHTGEPLKLFFILLSRLLQKLDDVFVAFLFCRIHRCFPASVGNAYVRVGIYENDY